MGEANLFKLLQSDWQATAHGPAAVAACAHWGSQEPALAGLASPAEIVTLCEDRTTRERSATLLRAVLSQVGTGPWPARTVLQSILPGLLSVARQARHLVGPHTRWQRRDELDHELIRLAYQRIQALAGDPPQCPAMAIIDGTRRRLRMLVEADRRRRRREPLVDDDAWHALAEVCQASAATAGAELVDALVQAVDAGILQHNEGWLIYASRAEGWSVEQLAPEIGKSARAAERRRGRAELRLVGCGPALLVAAGR